MLKAVLLDIDGTLVDSNAAHAASWSAASTRYGFERPESFFQPLIGMGGDRVLPLIDPTLSEDAEPGKSIAAARGDIFRTSYLPGLRATPGARSLVALLHGCGLRCIVASSTEKRDLDALLAVADVAEFIDERTTAEDAPESKPAPDIVTAALSKGGVTAGEAFMLGDTPHDIRAAATAGVGIIALRCGGWKDDHLAGALAIYDDPADLLRNLRLSPIGRALIAS